MEISMSKSHTKSQALSLGGRRHEQRVMSLATEFKPEYILNI